MTPRRQKSFERPYAPEDHAVFDELVSGLVGQELSRWRDTYADGLVLEFGRLVPRHRKAENLPPDRGEWVISPWGGSWVLHTSEGKIHDSGESGPDAIRQYLGQNPRVMVAGVRMVEPDLSLELRLANGDFLSVIATTDIAELDQWFIITPNGWSVGVTGLGMWYYREG